MELYGVLVLIGSAVAMVAFLIDDLRTARRFPRAPRARAHPDPARPAAPYLPASAEESLEEAA